MTNTDPAGPKAAVVQNEPELSVAPLPGFKLAAPETTLNRTVAPTTGPDAPPSVTQSWLGSTAPPTPDCMSPLVAILVGGAMAVRLNATG